MTDYTLGGDIKAVRFEYDGSHYYTKVYSQWAGSYTVLGSQLYTVNDLFLGGDPVVLAFDIGGSLYYTKGYRPVGVSTSFYGGGTVMRPRAGRSDADVYGIQRVLGYTLKSGRFYFPVYDSCSEVIAVSPIVDLPVRVCNTCSAVWVEDENMYADPARCPHCGAYPRLRADGWEDMPDV